MVKELLVATKNPKALDGGVQFTKAVVGQDINGEYAPEFDKQNNVYFVVRCFGDAEFTRYVIEKQGYGRVIGERDVEPPTREISP